MSPPFPIQFPIICPSIVDSTVTYTIEQNHRFACIPPGEASEGELRASVESCRDEDGPSCIFRDVCKMNDGMMVGLFRMDREVVFVEDGAEGSPEAEPPLYEEEAAPAAAVQGADSGSPLLGIDLILDVGMLFLGAEIFYED